MGVYIPNIDKPKSCLGCPVDEKHCNLWKDFDSWETIIHPDCPLIEIDDEIWEALKPKVETMSLAERGWITDDSNT